MDNEEKNKSIDACIKVLMPLYSVDLNNKEIREALYLGREILKEYPFSYKHKNRILKKDSADYFVNVAINLLALCIIETATQNAFDLIQEALNNALEGLQ